VWTAWQGRAPPLPYVPKTARRPSACHSTDAKPGRPLSFLHREGAPKAAIAPASDEFPWTRQGPIVSVLTPIRIAFVSAAQTMDAQVPTTAIASIAHALRILDVSFNPVAPGDTRA
jgi:hypothetical protein